jgi:DNA polymerase-3 subunit alpha
MPLQEKLAHERELLGFYVSGHPMNPYQAFARAIDTFTGNDYLKMEQDEPWRLCGVITGVAKKISRRDNRPWAIINLATTGETYTLNAYADCYEQHTGIIEESRIVLIEGKVIRRQDDEVQLAATAVKPLERAASELIRSVTFIIEGNGHSSSFIQDLRAELDRHMGKTPVRLGILVDQDQVAVADLAPSLEWELTHERFLPLSRHPAVRDIQLVIPEPEAPPPRWGRRS